MSGGTTENFQLRTEKTSHLTKESVIICMKPRKSIIWKVSPVRFAEMVKNAKSMSELLRGFGLENKGNNFLTCKKRIFEEKIDISHFLQRIESSVLSKTVSKETLLERMEAGERISRNWLKRKLIRFKILPYTCRKCKIDGYWQGERLSLQLEHKDGNPNNNRLQNLEFLCPNCHSQTPSFAGKLLKKRYWCLTCGGACSKKSERCNKCRGVSIRKIDRPTKEELEARIKEMPMLHIAKQYGLKSENTLRKWCASYQIDYKVISPTSRLNRRAPLKKGFVPKSKYLYVVFRPDRNVWQACKKDKKAGKTIFCKTFKTEEEAAKFVAGRFGSEKLIQRIQE